MKDLNLFLENKIIETEEKLFRLPEDLKLYGPMMEKLKMEKSDMEFYYDISKSFKIEEGSKLSIEIGKNGDSINLLFRSIGNIESLDEFFKDDFDELFDLGYGLPVKTVPQNLYLAAGYNYSYTYVKIESSLLSQLIILLASRPYKVRKFKMGLALKAFKQKQSNKSTKSKKKTKKLKYFDSDGKPTERDVIKKKYWRRHFWKKVKMSKPIALPNYNKSRVLVLIQGTGKPRTGFYEFLCTKEILERLNNIYEDKIFLFTFPTLFQSLSHNVSKIVDLISSMGLDTREVDIIGTSRGGLVARNLVAEYGPKNLDGFFIKRLLCVNSPNTGTPMAEDLLKFLENAMKVGDSIGKGIFSILLKATARGIIDSLIGIEDQKPTSNALIAINKNYNKILKEVKIHHYFMGTENSHKSLISKIVFTDNTVYKKNDKKVPTKSMLGKDNGNSNFNYSGEFLNNVNNVESNIIMPKKGGQKHGSQFRTLLLLDKIMEALEKSLPPTT